MKEKQIDKQAVEVTCEDCIHYDICIFHLKGNENEKCPHFKNKAGYRKQSEYTVELPCKVGQQVWCIVDGVSFNPIEAHIYSITIQAEGIIMRCGLKGYYGVSYMKQDLGKKFFTTKEEAENVLAKMKGR